VIEGMRQGAGGDTPPLREDASGRLRHREFRSGVGEQDGVTGGNRSERSS
jgi:hypothetical protein